MALAALLCLPASGLRAQWCTFIAEPYDANMPGITHFKLNTIDRTSAALEDMNNSFINTGLSTTLVKGQTYTIAITHNIDASICPDMNIRVWIDYNQNYMLNDAGETAITTDHHAPGTYTASFTVPTTAKTGTTRLRATVKMSDNGGHTLPTSCNNPADPIGYHGEVEDYIVVITDAAGIDEAKQKADLAFNVFPNPSQGKSVISYTLVESTQVNLEVYNVLGQKIATLVNNQQGAGTYTNTFDPGAQAAPGGIYIIRLSAGEQVLTQKLVTAVR